MDDLGEPNKVSMDVIGKEIEVHLGEEVGFILVASKHEEKQLHPHVIKEMKKKKKTLSHIKLNKGNSNIFELSCV